MGDSDGERDPRELARRLLWWPSPSSIGETSGRAAGRGFLEYNEDPAHLRDLLLYKLTLETQKRIETNPLSKREIVRRLGTSAAQLYRLLDQTKYRKSVDKLMALLRVLECDVDLVVRAKTA